MTEFLNWFIIKFDNGLDKVSVKVNKIKLTFLNSCLRLIILLYKSAVIFILSSKRISQIWDSLKYSYLLKRKSYLEKNK